MYRITERVEAEYGPNDYSKIANVIEPFGFISLWTFLFIILYAALFC